MNAQPRVIILVLTCLNRGFEVMDNCVRETWGRALKQRGVDVYYMYSCLNAQADYQIIEGTNTILCKGVEEYHTIYSKTLKAFKAIQGKNFDYVLRTNSSSFIHFDNLLKYLSTAPSNNFYSGALIPYHTSNLGLEFITGSGYILSKDLLLKVIQNETHWEPQYPDDVGLGKLLKELNVVPTPKAWLKVSDIPGENINEKIEDAFHLRCKIETRYDIETQCYMMQELTRLIYA